MKTNRFYGDLVRLCPIDIDKDSEKFSLWARDSDYLRLLDISPATRYAPKLTREWFEKENNSGHFFMIHTLEEDKVIGFIELDGFDWCAGNAWVGIGIGDADYRGKGYGTDAMKILIRYAFTELNLHRVNLCVFDFNKRAIRSYEKAGFVYEGVERARIYKDDQRWGVIHMGILQSEWLRAQQPEMIEEMAM